LRIGLLTSQYPGVRLGGIGVYSLACARGLARAGHEVHVFTLVLPANAQRNWGDGIHVHELDVPPLDSSAPGGIRLGGATLYRLASARAFAGGALHVHRKTPLDILEAPEYEAPASLLLGGDIPVITHIHSGTALAGIAGAESFLRESLELEVLLGADAVCAPSRAVLEDTRETYTLPNLRPDAEILHLPFDADIPPFELPLPDAPILFVGRLERLKGADLLALAANDFLHQHATARLSIIGPDTMTAPSADAGPSRTGRSMADWMRAQLSPDISSRVTFLGEMTRPQIAAEMRNAAFIVVPSRRESYSYVCCEALAAGRPVVVSSDIGAAEVVAYAGLIFQRGNVKDLTRALSELYTDPPRLKDLSLLAWQRASNVLTGQGVTTLRLAFYQRIIEQRKSQGLAPIHQRLSTLPPSHAARVRVARAIADGSELPELDQALKQSELTSFVRASLTPGERVVQRLDASPNPYRFYLYGAGRHTAALLLEKALWEAKGYRLVCLIDDHPRFAPSPDAPSVQFYGLPVISLRTAEQTLQPTDTVILSTDAFEDQFWRQSEPLRAKGVTVHRLYGDT
jgi:glycosyltransferase involved in cell wall biosynthesis